MNTADQEFMAKIGDGVEKITHAELVECVSKGYPTGISKIDGKWVIDSAVPSATKGTIEASDIDLDLEHIDIDEYDENWTVTDYILEEIRREEERQDDAAAAIKADEEHRALEEEEAVN